MSKIQGSAFGSSGTVVRALMHYEKFWDQAQKSQFLLFHFCLKLKSQKASSIVKLVLSENLTQLCKPKFTA